MFLINMFLKKTCISVKFHQINLVSQLSKIIIRYRVNKFQTELLINHKINDYHPAPLWWLFTSVIRMERVSHRTKLRRSDFSLYLLGTACFIMLVLIIPNIFCNKSSPYHHACSCAWPCKKFHTRVRVQNCQIHCTGMWENPVHQYISYVVHIPPSTTQISLFTPYTVLFSLLQHNLPCLCHHVSFIFSVRINNIRGSTRMKPVLPFNGFDHYTVKDKQESKRLHWCRAKINFIIFFSRCKFSNFLIIWETIRPSTCIPLPCTLHQTSTLRTLDSRAETVFGSGTEPRFRLIFGWIRINA